MGLRVCVALCVEPVLEAQGEREEKKKTVGKPRVLGCRRYCKMGWYNDKVAFWNGKIE